MFVGDYDLEPERAQTLRAEQVHAVEGRPVPELLTRDLEVIGDDQRIHSIALARALCLGQADLADLLGALGVRMLPNPFERNGEQLRGYERQHLEEAAEAIRRGELQVPPEVADWPAA
ncbi:hypothetical protein [Streptosporangium sp. NPDC003464]